MATHLTTRYSASRRPDSSARRHTGASPYQVVTDRIVKALEEGVVPWRRPWYETDALPCNAVSHRQYHGVNLLLLGLSRFADHRWLTFRQAQELGGQVRSGEQSSIAVFWKELEFAKDEQDESSEAKVRRVPLLRFYHLFNVAQCEGLVLPEPEGKPSRKHERIARAEALVDSVPNAPCIREGARSAAYSPRSDVVEIPGLNAFETPDSYYATLFHELGHATGHASRLNRPEVIGTPRFGSSNYSREELVAELASAFLCAEIGLDNSLIDNAAGYIDGWLRALKADTKALVAASTQAQRAADYLRGSLHGCDQIAPIQEVPA